MYAVVYAEVNLLCIILLLSLPKNQLFLPLRIPNNNICTRIRLGVVGFQMSTKGSHACFADYLASIFLMLLLTAATTIVHFLVRKLNHKIV